MHDSLSERGGHQVRIDAHPGLRPYGSSLLQRNGKRIVEAIMGLLGNLISSAQETLSEKHEEARVAAEEKARKQDEGWAHQLRLKHVRVDRWGSAHDEAVHIRDRNRKDLYIAEAGLFSPKRRTIITDMAKNKVASLHAARFNGIGIDSAIDVQIGGTSVGRVIKRKSGFYNDFDRDYHFEPFGLRLSFEGGFKNARYEIQNPQGELVAAAYYCGIFDEDWLKVNFNDESSGFLYVVMILAMEDIDEKAWEK